MSEETPLPSADDAAVESPTSPSTPPAWESNGSGGSSVEATDSVAEAAAAPDDGTAFLASLAGAMKEAATAERTRVTEDIDRRRDAHLQEIETRRESEAGRIRQLADDDRAAVQAWVDAEHQRIGEERDRRIAAVDADLEGSLAEHGAKIDAEKERIETAIATYRTDVDAYFHTLEGETDPVSIAQQAGRRPAFPDLEAISREDPTAAPADGSSTSVDTGTPDAGRLIGVMASSRPTTKLSQAWAAWNASTEAASASSPDVTGTEATSSESSVEATPTVIDPQINPVDPSPAPEAEPVAVAAGAIESSAEAAPETPATPDVAPEAAPQSSSSFGGMSWLRRDKGNDQKS